MPIPLAIGAIVSLALSAAQAGASYSSSKQQASGARFNARQGYLRAEQTDAVYRENIESDLAQIRAARAANGLARSPTGASLLSERRRVANRERAIEVGNRRAEGDAFARQAQQITTGGRVALFKAGASAIGDLYGAYSLFGTGVTAKPFLSSKAG